MDRASVYADTVAEGQKASALYLPGLGTNYISCPDADRLDITGDIDIRVKIAPNSWDATSYLAVKDAGAWYFRFNNNRTLDFYNYGTYRLSRSVAVSGLVANQPKWLRVTFDVDNGAGGNTIKFWQSDDGSTWTQVGNDSTAAGAVALPVTGGALVLGVFTPGSGIGALVGTYHAAEVRNGIDGPIVASWDGRIPATRQRDPQGNIWTVNGTANGWVTV